MHNRCLFISVGDGIGHGDGGVKCSDLHTAYILLGGLMLCQSNADDFKAGELAHRGRVMPKPYVLSWFYCRVRVQPVILSHVDH